VAADQRYYFLVTSSINLRNEFKTLDDDIESTLSFYLYQSHCRWYSGQDLMS